MKLYLGNCLNVMRRKIADETQDTIITDPPYGLKFMGKYWDKGVPGVVFWEEMLRVAKPGASLLAFGGTRTHHRLMCAIEDAGWEIRDCLMWLYGQGFPKSHNIERVTKNELWQGWGTGLKPAWEPIILAMKPMSGTFAQNALDYGVSGLWIDGGRIKTNEIITTHSRGSNQAFPKRTAERTAEESGRRMPQDRAPELPRNSRWPANLLLCHTEDCRFVKEVWKCIPECPVRMLNEQSGQSTSSAPRKTQGPNYRNRVYGTGFGGTESATNRRYDSGGASRFFYTAKASKKEKTCDGTVENDHPTVKPLSVMRYLCRLTRTPNGGAVLDPFMGSGTTGRACILENREFTGIELDRHSFDIARQCIRWQLRQSQVEMGFVYQ